ncbi:sensor histidine kinase [Clostridium cellulovorans]|uniref:Heme sensor protein HssS n=1 Tax=Clostridium cellulovorans (strain ATCC 35296 / DSM 3052 / OCM 3 / 743B) TaxID=573061 RepID=D9SP08_CLOC7|nr:HAMP domain-containing sensor histidine kinase [Clostridium cellulovorans]ADL51973.1 integral membrane sensor signal transduction histidine kinase [Clostridium cellulovorans 743B]
MNVFSKSIRTKFTLIFIGILCFSCVTSFGISLMLNYSLSKLHYINDNLKETLLLSITLVICALIGSILVFFVTKLIIKPLKKLSESTKEIAKGNFDINILYDSEDELGILAKNFNLMAKELKNIEYLQKDFIVNVSHEFKTPIASIQGFVEIIKDKSLPETKFDEYTDIIIEETKRLSNLSTNILRLSRLDSQMISKNRVIFSLDEQLRKTLLLLEDQWSLKNLELEINLEKVNYIGDEELIQQIWVNILGNAIKFSYDNGTISVKLKDNPSSVIVEIADQGIGISEEIENHVFEKFYQGDTSHSKEGNGLGLAIVKRIIEICNGTIYFKTKYGKGTTFTVTLPKEFE